MNKDKRICTNIQGNLNITMAQLIECSIQVPIQQRLTVTPRRNIHFLPNLDQIIFPQKLHKNS